MSGYTGKASKKKLQTKNENDMQPSGKNTMKKVVAALKSDDWTSCQDVIAKTGFTASTVSRAAAHLLSDDIIVKKTVKKGRGSNVYYKLVRK